MEVKEEGRKEKQNKVIIIGYDHINPLGLVRSFGKNGIKPYGIIICKFAQKGFVYKSKYWKRVWTVGNAKEAIRIMCDVFRGEERKPVIFPCTDDLEMYIDVHMNELKKDFILPSINGKQGAVVELMDKFRQMQFAKENGIKMAKSWKMEVSKDKLPEDIKYPCIFKPLISAEGKKADIQIIESKRDAIEQICIYRKKGYRNILIQEYIQYSYELMLAGSCADRITYTVERKLRTWPIVIGRTSFAEAVCDREILSECEKVLNAIMKIGYCGLVDIEFFETKDGIYLNEINWRNTGISALAMASGVHYAVEWYYQMIGIKNTGLNVMPQKKWYCMNDIDDFKYVIKRKIGYFEWKKDKEKVSAFMYYDKEDILPYIFYIFMKIKRKIRG